MTPWHAGTRVGAVVTIPKGSGAASGRNWGPGVRGTATLAEGPLNSRGCLCPTLPHLGRQRPEDRDLFRTHGEAGVAAQPRAGLPRGGLSQMGTV